MRYERLDLPGDRATIHLSVFAPARLTREAHLIISSAPAAHFSGQLDALAEAYHLALTNAGFAPECACFCRVFLRDAARQTPLFRESTLWRTLKTGHAAVSVIEQPPLPESEIALWVYLVDEGKDGSREVCEDGVLLRRGRLAHHWTAGIESPLPEGGAFSPAEQTENIFSDYAARLRGIGGNLKDNAVRTWVFVRDVDRNYRGMVDARREFFTAQGMTANTHYIASTGIEGRRAEARATVSLDAYAATGLREGQARFLHAPDRLGPTHLYGVTFERGVKVRYADRSHVFISGTASIDPAGRTLHVGDVLRQLDRALENIRALLDDAGATFADMAQMIVYLRDPADRRAVCAHVETLCPDVPYVCVQAPVCRPEWLVEIEGIAVAPDRAPEFEPF